MTNGLLYCLIMYNGRVSSTKVNIHFRSYLRYKNYEQVPIIITGFFLTSLSSISHGSISRSIINRNNLKFELARNSKLQIFSLRNSTLAVVDLCRNNILYTFALRDDRRNVAWNVIILLCHLSVLDFLYAV